MDAESRRAYVRAAGQRYRGASKSAKGAILEAVCRDTGYSRKYAGTLLKGGAARSLTESVRPTARRAGPRGRPAVYGHRELVVLRLCWAVSDGIAAKRLAPYLDELLRQLAVADELPALATPEVMARVAQMSAATIDRHLRAERRLEVGSGRSLTKPGTLLKQQIPIRTFAQWDEAQPGFLEMDLVAHCGPTGAGEFLFTLSTVDVATGWVLCVGVRNKGELAVFTALEALRARLPFPLLGLDSDNGGEFINRNLLRWCEQEHITLTRSRPYHKNDNCYVEQKNWSVVRRLVGYARFEQFALLTLNQVYALARDYVNFCQPVLKLREKVRDGARVTKRYDAAQTPYRRLLATQTLDAGTAVSLAARYQALRPRQLKQDIEQAQAALQAHAIVLGAPRPKVSGGVR